MSKTTTKMLPWVAAGAALLLLKNKNSINGCGVGVVEETVVGRLLVIDGHRNSYAGNPSWHLVVQTEDGRILDGRTAPNASAGYFLSSSMQGSVLKFTYHRTPSGKVIFNYIRGVNASW